MELIPGRDFSIGNGAIGIGGGWLEGAKTGNVIGYLTSTRDKQFALSLNAKGIAIRKTYELQPRRTDNGIGLPADIARPSSAVAKG